MWNRKQKILTAAVATVLAAAMLIGGGTFAYLQDETNDVVNNFETNQVLVDLDETTGSDYEIIPGTSQEKDPTVTVNTTIPAYVYVTVTDETDGLVGYEIADGWQQLLDGEGNPVENVYYREVEGSDAEQQFPVLEGNRVTYDASLVNEDMWDENGNLKVDVKLTFSASAIQKEPFNDPYDAYVEEENLIMNEQELVEAIAAKAPIKIGQDFTVSTVASLDDVIPDADLVDVDLNGYTVTFAMQEDIGDSTLAYAQNIKFRDGGLNINHRNGQTFNVFDGSSLTLENVTCETNATFSYYVQGSGSTINIINSTVTGVGDTSMCALICTNANSPANYGVIINIQDSVLDTVYTDGWTVTAIMMNVPGTLNIDNSTVTGEKHAVFLRGGTAVIRDSTLSRPYEISEANETRQDSTWGQNNNASYSTLTVGNLMGGTATTSYQYPASAELYNTTVSAYETVDGRQGRAIYLCGNYTEGNGATLTYDADCVFDGQFVQGNDYVTVNAPA